MEPFGHATALQYAVYPTASHKSSVTGTVAGGCTEVRLELGGFASVQIEVLADDRMAWGGLLLLCGFHRKGAVLVPCRYAEQMPTGWISTHSMTLQDTVGNFDLTVAQNQARVRFTFWGRPIPPCGTMIPPKRAPRGSPLRTHAHLDLLTPVSITEVAYSPGVTIFRPPLSRPVVMALNPTVDFQWQEKRGRHAAERLSREQLDEVFYTLLSFYREGRSAEEARVNFGSEVRLLLRHIHMQSTPQLHDDPTTGLSLSSTARLHSDRNAVWEGFP